MRRIISLAVVLVTAATLAACSTSAAIEESAEGIGGEAQTGTLCEIIDGAMASELLGYEVQAVEPIPRVPSNRDECSFERADGTPAAVYTVRGPIESDIADAAIAQLTDHAGCTGDARFDTEVGQASVGCSLSVTGVVYFRSGQFLGAAGVFSDEAAADKAARIAEAIASALQ